MDFTAREAPSVAAAIEAGNVPALQRGSYDLRVDRELERRAWQKTIDGRPPRIDVAQRSANPLDVADLTPSPGASPIAVVIPVRDRAGQRLRNTLRSLQWQSAGAPAEVVVVSHGSRPEIDRELETLCGDEGARLISLSRPSEPWNKCVALNTGIRRSPAAADFLMTMDADIVLAPDFLLVVIERLRQHPPALVLCRISDLPAQACLPSDRDALLHAFDRLRPSTSLRSRCGSGGIQAAARAFFFAIRGYDEDLAWWGAMDGDILNRARLMGLELDWIEHRTAMLHQWHPRKHAALSRPEQISAAKQAWRANHALVRARRYLLQRNLRAWGGEVDDSAVAVRGGAG